MILSEQDRVFLKDYFNREIMPVIAPLSIDPAHPFPFIANKGFGLYLGLEDQKGKANQALIMLSPRLKRFISSACGWQSSGNAADRFIALEDCIIQNLDQIFPNHDLRNSFTFRVLRDSELEVDDEAEDLVATFESALKARRRGNVIALELSAKETNAFTESLCEAMGVIETDVAYVGGMLGLG